MCANIIKNIEDMMIHEHKLRKSVVISKKSALEREKLSKTFTKLSQIREKGQNFRKIFPKLSHDENFLSSCFFYVYFCIVGSWTDRR